RLNPKQNGLRRREGRTGEGAGATQGCRSQRRSSSVREVRRKDGEHSGSPSRALLADARLLKNLIDKSALVDFSEKTHIGKILWVELFCVPVSRRNTVQLCLHPFLVVLHV